MIMQGIAFRIDMKMGFDEYIGIFDEISSYTEIRGHVEKKDSDPD